MPPPRKALIVDVDGVVSPVHGRTAWGDDVTAGNVFGPVLVSPRLCARLDDLAQTPGLSCWWLTSWSIKMRTAMHPFPGRGWPAVADPAQAPMGGRTWWKLAALETWLDQHAEMLALAWCDDDLRGGRPRAVRRRLASRGLEPLLLSPRTEVGLTPAHLDQLESWAMSLMRPQ
ncbi:HAD domain-containing protein [Nocardioides sp. MAHUQ-72]|uniref:HAD domain-containing protein n=1 Tax=unclassified Nocardioides TaxID=2615069 RepID=UPI00361FE9F9